MFRFLFVSNLDISSESLHSFCNEAIFGKQVGCKHCFVVLHSVRTSQENEKLNHSNSLSVQKYNGTGLHKDTQSVIQRTSLMSCVLLTTACKTCDDWYTESYNHDSCSKTTILKAFLCQQQHLAYNYIPSCRTQESNHFSIFLLSYTQFIKKLSSCSFL